jgi:alkylated DNA repair protein alkB homolog 8
VRHYGFQFEYGSNIVNPDQPLDEKIPDECDFVSKRLTEQKLVAWVPEQLTVNQYEPGQGSFENILMNFSSNLVLTGIPPHIDTHSAFLEPIMSLSLESDVVMEFRKNSTVVPVFLPRRSLLMMTGESR